MSQLPTIQPGQPGALYPPVLPPNPAPGYLLQLWLRRLLEDWLRRRQIPPPDNKPVPPPPDPPLAEEQAFMWMANFDGDLVLRMDALRRLGATNPEAADDYTQMATYCNLYGIPYQTSFQINMARDFRSQTVPGAPAP